MKKHRLPLYILAILVMVCFAACSASAKAGTTDFTPGEVKQTPYDTEGLVLTPVPVEKGADELSGEELLAIYEALYSQASSAYALSFIEQDIDDMIPCDDDGICYYGITNFSAIDEIMRNFEAVFSYDLVQGTIFPDVFVIPNTVGGIYDTEWATIVDRDEKLYISVNAAGFVPSHVVDTAEVIYQSRDMFKVRLTFVWQDGTTQPYILTILNQNGLWVLNNYYFYDIVEHTLLALA